MLPKFCPNDITFRVAECQSVGFPECLAVKHSERESYGVAVVKPVPVAERIAERIAE